MGKMKRIDIGFPAMTKDQLLKQIQKHLDKEFRTDVVTDSVMTITNEGQRIMPPAPPPKRREKK